MAQVKMRVSLSGTLRNAVRTLKELRDGIRSEAGWNEEDNEDDEDFPDPAGDADCSVFCLEEIIKHAESTRKGEHSVDEFADFYCLKERAE